MPKYFQQHETYKQHHRQETSDHRRRQETSGRPAARDPRRLQHRHREVGEALESFRGEVSEISISENHRQGVEEVFRRGEGRNVFSLSAVVKVVVVLGGGIDADRSDQTLGITHLRRSTCNRHIPYSSPLLRP